MSYEKQNFKDGNRLYAEQLEKMEDGIIEAISAANACTYGTEDMTAGTSPLETGKLYFVYE